MASNANTPNRGRRARKPAPLPKPRMIGIATSVVTRRTGARSTAFRAKERLAAVGSNAIQQYHWNPGMASTFSLGHQLARGFEKYSVMPGGNRVTFVSSAPTTLAGRIYMYANYDPSDRLPTTEDDFADRSDGVSSSVWAGLTLLLKGDQMTPGGSKPIRVGNTSQDKNITDGCLIVVGVFGVPADFLTSIGNMFLDYNALLHVQRPLPTGPALPRSAAYFSLAAISVLGVDQSVEFTTDFDTIGLTPGADSFVLPPGVYNISYRVDLQQEVPNKESVEYVAQILVADEVLDGATSRLILSEVPAGTHGDTLASADNFVAVSEPAVVYLRLDNRSAAPASIQGDWSRIVVKTA